MPVGPKRRRAVLARGVGFVALEVRARGVKEEQVDLEIEQVGGGEEHRLLDLGLGVGLDQQIHRPVGLVLVHRVKARDVRVLADPLRGGQLGPGLQRPVSDQREQHPLDIGREAARAEHPAQRAIDPQLLPQRIQQPRPAQRAARR